MSACLCVFSKNYLFIMFLVLVLDVVPSSFLGALFQILIRILFNHCIRFLLLIVRIFSLGSFAELFIYVSFPRLSSGIGSIV